MTTRAVIHIGPVKTGTSALAKYLTVGQVRGILPPTVYYPVGEDWLDSAVTICKQGPGLQLLVGKVLGKSLNSKAQAVADAVQVVGRNLRNREDSSTAIFIYETALGSTSRASLMQWFAPYFDEVTFVALARRQDKAIASLISQRIKMWNSPSTSFAPEDYVADESGFFRALDYSAMFKDWSVPQNPLRVIPYLEGEQGTHSLIVRIFEELDLPQPSEISPLQGKRVHPTFSRDGLEALARQKKRAQRLGWIPFVRKRIERQFVAESKIYHRAAFASGIEPSGKRFIPFALTPEESRVILEQYAASNEQLLQLARTFQGAPAWAQWEKGLTIHD